MDDIGEALPGGPAARPAAGRRSQVYLLRLWCDTAGAPWRLAVRTANGEAAIGLADLDELLVFLLRRMAHDGTDRRDWDE